MTAEQSRPFEALDVEVYKVDQRYRTIRTAIRGFAWVSGMFVAGRAIVPLAGEDTAISFAVSVLADFKFAFSLTLAGSAAAWAVIERRLRHKKTEYLQDRIIYLERQLDPDRSSSGLTRQGKTNPEDKRV